MFEQAYDLPQQQTASSEADPYSEDVAPKRQKKGKKKRTSANSHDDDDIDGFRRLDMVENAPRIRGTWLTRSSRKKKTSHQASVEDEAGEEDGDEIMFVLVCM